MIRGIFGDDDARRIDYVAALNTVNGLLHEATGETPLSKDRVLRLMGTGVSLLLGLAVEALGGDSEAADDPRQLRLFGEDDADKPESVT